MSGSFDYQRLCQVSDLSISVSTSETEKKFGGAKSGECRELLSIETPFLDIKKYFLTCQHVH
jgi:hypothetical protein